MGKNYNIYNSLPLFLIIFFPFMRPLGISFPAINVYLAFSMVIAICLILCDIRILLNKRIRGNSFYIIFILYSIALILITFYKVGFPSEGLQRLFAAPISLLLTCQWYKKNKRVVIDGIGIILGAELMISFLTNWTNIFGDLTFIGIRTIYHLILPFSFLISYLLYKQGTIHEKILGAEILLISIFESFFLKVSTALLVLFFIIIVYIFYRRGRENFIFKRQRTIIKNPIILVFICLLINYLVVFVRIQDYFSYLLLNVMNESMTLNGRTEIWDVAMPYIRRELVLGYGVYGIKIDMGRYWSHIEFNYLHSQFIQLLLDGGVVITSLFLMTIITIALKISKAWKKGCRIGIYIAVFSGILISMIAEVPTHYLYFYVFIGLLYSSLDGLYKKEVNNNEKNYFVCCKS